MALTSKARTRGDGFPIFPDAHEMGKDNANAVAALEKRLAEIKKGENNVSPAAIERMKKGCTVDAAKKRKEDLEKEKQDVLQKAAELYFQIQSRSMPDSGQQHGGSSAQPAVMDMEMVQRMCTTAASMAIAQHQQQEQTRQPLAIADTEVGKSLAKLETAIDKIRNIEDEAIRFYMAANEDEVREAAINKMSEEVTPEEALEAAVEKISDEDALEHAANQLDANEVIDAKWQDIKTLAPSSILKRVLRKKDILDLLSDSDEEVIVQLAKQIKKRRLDSYSDSYESESEDEEA